jgi:predicted transcriptional regulator
VTSLEAEQLDIGITSVILRGMKTAISIPDQLFNAVERMAKRLGISRSELFQRAVREFLRSQRDTGVKEALNEVYGPDRGEAKLDELLERMQASSIPEEEW